MSATKAAFRRPDAARSGAPRAAPRGDYFFGDTCSPDATQALMSTLALFTSTSSLLCFLGAERLGFHDSFRIGDGQQALVQRDHRRRIDRRRRQLSELAADQEQDVVGALLRGIGDVPAPRIGPVGRHSQQFGLSGEPRRRGDDAGYLARAIVVDIALRRQIVARAHQPGHGGDARAGRRRRHIAHDAPTAPTTAPTMTPSPV